MTEQEEQLLAVLQGMPFGKTKMKRIDFCFLQQTAGEQGCPAILGEAVESFAAGEAAGLCPESDGISRLLAYLLRELLRNTPEHAGKTEAEFFCRYLPEGYYMAGVWDWGRGISGSLAQNPVHRREIEKGREPLSYALQAGISEAFSPGRTNPSEDPWANSGFGFYMMKEICSACGGAFCLCSDGKALLTGADRKEQYEVFSGFGTAAGFVIDGAEILSHPGIIAKTAAEGERQARLTRAAFRKASAPSRGLMKQESGK